MSHRNRHRRTIRVVQGYVRSGQTIWQTPMGMSPKAARDRFLMAELLHGGNFVTLEPQKLVLRTQYPDYIGKLELTGSYDEMKPLFTIASCWEKASRHPASVAAVEEMQKRRPVVDQEDISALPFVRTLGPNQVARIRLKVAAMLLVGFDDKAINYGLGLSQRGLMEALQSAKGGKTLPLAAVATA